MNQKKSSNPPKKTEIKVDKDFLMKILEKIEGLSNEVITLKQGAVKTVKTETPAKQFSPDKKYIFQTAQVVSVDRLPPTPQDVMRHQQKTAEFRRKLEGLMKEYRIVQSTAMFLVKL